MEEVGIFAAGCFWGVEDTFYEITRCECERRSGIPVVRLKIPRMRWCAVAGTGHKEAVEVVFNSEKISYEDLLKSFLEHARSDHRESAGF